MSRFAMFCCLLLVILSACLAKKDSSSVISSIPEETGSVLLPHKEIIPAAQAFSGNSGTGSWGAFDITVDVYAWTGNSETGDTCEVEPCLDYTHSFTLEYGHTSTLIQRQSWPVMVKWSSEVPVTVPALGITEPVAAGEAYFNPWQDITVAFCNGWNCQTRFTIHAVTLPERNDCVEQTVDGMYTRGAAWINSQGEAYGVSNVSGAYCTHWSCTDFAPAPACENGLPNAAECGPNGCQCNLDPWTHPSASELRYNAAATAASGVRAPWFADRWETGGLHALNDGNTVFRMSTKVSLSDPNLLFRPVIDMRTNWDGVWDTIPDPDGWEGPPLFHNSVNEFIAPADGYWPITWEVTPDSSTVDLWLQPVWNIIVRPGGETGTANLRNLRFQACGSAVNEIICDYNGCSY